MTEIEDETARQAILEAAQHIDDLRAVISELVGTLAATRDRRAMLSERHARMVERVSAIEARMHNDGK